MTKRRSTNEVSGALEAIEDPYPFSLIRNASANSHISIGLETEESDVGTLLLLVTPDERKVLLQPESPQNPRIPQNPRTPRQSLAIRPLAEPMAR